jgi:hypothetical protein
VGKNFASDLARVAAKAHHVHRVKRERWLPRQPVLLPETAPGQSSRVSERYSWCVSWCERFVRGDWVAPEPARLVELKEGRLRSSVGPGR